MPDEATVEEPEAPAAIETPETPVEPETVTMPRQEADALRRRLSEAEREKRKLADEQKKADEARKAEQGQFQEIAEKRERELTAERAERSRVEREQRITRLAAKAKFVDPADVIGRITADEGIDDSAVETALERIAKLSPHLVAKETPARPEIGQVLEPSATAAASADGKPAPPAGKAPLQSLNEWEGLPQIERSARMAEADWLVVNEQ
jgi:hypothetical protein